MDITGFLAFASIACLASYVQAFTGFAFGLVLLSGVALLGLMPVEQAALIVGLLTLVNAGHVVATGQGAIVWRSLAIVLAGAFTLLPVGYFLLRHLSAHDLSALSFILGATIMLCSALVLRPVKAAAEPASTASTLFFGAVSGLMTGLLSAGGPPLAYHFYRQPLPVAAIRETLTSVYAINQIVRLALAGMAGAISGQLLVVGALTMPSVLLGAYLAKRCPPPLPIAVFRSMIAGLLFLSGAALALPPMLEFMNRA
jgi:uncharacterized membrane protein YfcA